jgi:hypothetical protein
MSTSTKTSRLLSIVGSVVAVIGITAGIAMAQQFTFDGVGTVDVEEADGTVSLTSSTFINDFAVVEDESTPNEVELYVSSGTDTKKIEVELEDEGLVATIEDVPATSPSTTEGTTPSSTVPDGDDDGEVETETTIPIPDTAQTFDLPEDAGTVTVEVVDGKVMLTWEAAAGWEFVEYEQEGNEAEVEFRNGTLKVEFEAEIEDGQLEIETKVEFDADSDDSDDDDDDDHDDDEEDEDDEDDEDDD